MNKPKAIYSSATASTVAIVFVTLITIVAELRAPIKNWLASLSGHHWTSKGILSLLLYVIVALTIHFVVKDVGHRKVTRSLWVAIVATVLGSLLLLAFYTGHHLGFY